MCVSQAAARIKPSWKRSACPSWKRMRSMASEIVARVALSPKACRIRRSCGVKSVGVAGGEAAQQHRIASLGFRDAALALRRRGGRIESQHLVDELEIPVVVDEPWSVVTSV
jgi:predicted NAD/FAD-binding protein